MKERLLGCQTKTALTVVTEEGRPNSSLLAGLLSRFFQQTELDLNVNREGLQIVTRSGRACVVSDFKSS